MVFSESLLHFIWHYRLFDQLILKTEEDESVQVIDVGQPNQDAGPDFEFAKIRINDTLWSGHVEIHVKEEDWLLHHHQNDKRYNNTILHVVWDVSLHKSILRTDGTKIPTLVLKKYVDSDLLARYYALMNNLDLIPCAKQIQKVRQLTIESCLSRMAIGRLEQKFTAIEVLLQKTNQNWESVFLMMLGRSFGMRVNAETFEDFCSHLDLSLIHKYKDDTLKIESMIFGVAGLLGLDADEYMYMLQEEFSYLKHVHGLCEMKAEEWRFLRMRPYNFPTFRLAQLAALLQDRSYWFALVMEVAELKELFVYIDRVLVNMYWATHYRFGKLTDEHSIAWSLAFKSHLAINCFVPMLFAYGTFMKEEKYKEKALDWLNELPAEVNQITKMFSTFHIKCKHADDSQALLFLKKQYCDQKGCLACPIGLELLKN